MHFRKPCAVDLDRTAIGLTAGGEVVSISKANLHQQFFLSAPRGLIHLRDGRVLDLGREPGATLDDDVVLDLLHVPDDYALPTDVLWSLARTLLEHEAGDQVTDLFSRGELSWSRLTAIVHEFVVRHRRFGVFERALALTYRLMVAEE